jgi:hypothetical protein
MLVAKIAGLFPLHKVDAQLIGYYMNKHGEIFSTRQNAERARKLTGSNQDGIHFFTLALGNTAAVGKYPSKKLIKRAISHPEFVAETGFVSQQLQLEDVSTRSAEAQSHVSTLSDGIKKRGWVIGKVQGESIAFSQHPTIHATISSVKNEIQRLAAKTPGQQFIYLKIEGAVRANSFVWE